MLYSETTPFRFGPDDTYGIGLDGLYVKQWCMVCIVGLFLHSTDDSKENQFSLPLALFLVVIVAGIALINIAHTQYIGRIILAVFGIFIGIISVIFNAKKNKSSLEMNIERMPVSNHANLKRREPMNNESNKDKSDQSLK